MREAFTILYSKVVVATLLGVSLVALVLGRLRRRLRIDPDQRTRAPILWLVNLTADARLHRRLRRLASRARVAARGGSRHRRRHGISQSQRLAVDIAAEVVDLDERLVAARSEDFDSQRTIIKEIRADADRVEALIDRVTALIGREADDPSTTISADPIGAIESRLAQLESEREAEAARVIDTSSTIATRPAIETTALDSPS